ncbi:MAG: hypothetical protein ABR606_04085 [Vicinamibacterales bacterium]
MLSRRELMSGSIGGGLAPVVMAGNVEAQPIDREALREMIAALRGMRTDLNTLADGAELPSLLVTRLREQMSLFLRSSGKFPEYCEIGHSVFYQIYDWHVKNGQTLAVGRLPDGRYLLQFMFTQLVLRPEADPSFIGPPYDNR